MGIEMLADDVITLIVIMGDGKLPERPAKNRKGTADSPVGTLCQRLVRRGYLAACSPGEYQSTARGRKALLREIVTLVGTEDETWVKDRLEHLQVSYDDISQRVGTETQANNQGLPAMESTVPYIIKTEAAAEIDMGGA